MRDVLRSGFGVSFVALLFALALPRAAWGTDDEEDPPYTDPEDSVWVHAQGQYPLDERILVITASTFYEALDSGMKSGATEEYRDLAVSTAKLLNDHAALGIMASRVEGPISFEGNLFLVMHDQKVVTQDPSLVEARTLELYVGHLSGETSQLAVAPTIGFAGYFPNGEACCADFDDCFELDLGLDFLDLSFMSGFPMGGLGACCGKAPSGRQGQAGVIS